GISVVPTNPSLPLSQTLQLQAVGTFSDSTMENLTNSVVWNSSNGGVVTVTNTPGSRGILNPVTAGSSTLAAISGQISGSTTVTVNPVASLQSITVTPSNKAIALGTSLQFTATGNYSSGPTQDLTTSVTWSAS